MPEQESDVEKPDGAQSEGRLSSGSCVLCSGQTYGNDEPCSMSMITEHFYDKATENVTITAIASSQFSKGGYRKCEFGSHTHLGECVWFFFDSRLFLEERQIVIRLEEFYGKQDKG